MTLMLLDTNIVSFLVKGDSRAAAYAREIVGHELSISLMTVAELFQWAAIRRWGERRTNQLEAYLIAHYQIISPDIVTSRLWGDIRAQGQRLGRPVSPQDAWIAATALQYDLQLITHNTSDFASVEGVRLISIAE